MPDIGELGEHGWQSITQQYMRRMDILLTKVHLGVAFDPGVDPHPKTVLFNGIWDTGASSTCVSPSVVTQLGIAATGVRECKGASGPYRAHTYLVSALLKLPGADGGVWVPELCVSEAALDAFDVLIGMDIIALGDFAVTNHGGKTTLTFRIPSRERIDFTAQKPQHRTSGEPGRNERCPCGSGKKYKQCCGRSS